MWAAPSHGLGSQDEEKEESELRVKDQRPLLSAPRLWLSGGPAASHSSRHGESCTLHHSSVCAGLHPQTVSQIKPSLLTSPP